MRPKDTTNLSPEQLARLERKRAADREYAAAHREEAKAKAKAWYHSHKAQAKTNRKAYAEDHREQLLQAKKDYYQANIDRMHARDRERNNTEKRRIYNREWVRGHAEKNRAKVQAWAKAHPEHAKELRTIGCQAYRAKKTGVTTERISRKAIFERDKGICGICGKKVKPEDVSLDHILPISCGGSHTRDNVQLAHLACNKRKGAGAIPSQLRLSI